eukprot:TRINITY_DN7624_c0_g1_i1.p1 TRINITY_DN7624_c0_g1~~TRINITY_DN7624_c0_g1_i1.p1  ORF type:complete len:437 (-),score=96.00 TRINITY_DN7624_c0_g1_i1:235-1545(-)
MAEIKAFVTSLPAAPSSVGPSTLPLGAARRWASTQCSPPPTSPLGGSVSAVGLAAGVASVAVATLSSSSATSARRAERRLVACRATSTKRRTEQRVVFPFSGIIGQKEMKLALILNVIDPKIGGVMILGDRGTGKTTTIRALVDLLPEITCVSDDPYNSSPEEFDAMSDEVRQRKAANEDLPVSMRKVPMVDLPLGATEDRVCGTIDIEKALTQGKKAFEPGLLAKANRGILYVDEVNLLDDHLVDVLLDSAAGGWNTVEREGISIRHPAKFILVGSGNPEEGELRPQLLDRFGMHAMIRTEPDPELRVQIVEGCQEFADDPKAFRATFDTENAEIAKLIVDAQKLLPDVVMPDELKVKISEVCSELNVDGLRGDIVSNRAARAYAAYEGRTEVTEADVRKVLTPCLRHRLRKDVLDTMDSGDRVEKVCAKVFDDE